MANNHKKIAVTNRQARYNYEILETFEAGIELKGSEVKSVRAGKANLKDSFAAVEQGELFIFNCHISPYGYAPVFCQEDPKRKRKLLMHKRQIMRLMGQVSQKGLTLVPLSLYFKKGLCKVELALVKGKKLFDKRRTVKERQLKRELMGVKGCRSVKHRNKSGM
jgi:SsrA-binding protein